MLKEVRYFLRIITNGMRKRGPVPMILVARVRLGSAQCRVGLYRREGRTYSGVRKGIQDIIRMR